MEAAPDAALTESYWEGIAKSYAEDVIRLTQRVRELETRLNTPEVVDFAKAVQIEAAHQRERWGSEHDAGKTDADWFWLIGYLAGKALNNPPPPDGECKCPTNTQALRALGLDIPPEQAATPEGRAICHLAKCRIEKKLHRIVTVAAAAANWHAATLGQTNMRPGIDPTPYVDGSP